MKIKIKAVKTVMGNYFWKVETPHNWNAFETNEGAFEYVRKYIKRYQKESSAASMVRILSVNLLSIKEAEFVYKLEKSNCKGITKRQYGYLKGIYERQQREW